MIRYELYNPLTQKSLGFFKTEEECHIEAKGLLKYEIVTIHFSLRETKRIITKIYENLIIS